MTTLTTLTASTAAELSADITQIDNATAAGQTDDWVINIASPTNTPTTLTLTSDLPLLTLGAGSLTIQGDGSTLNGANKYDGLFAYSGTTTVNNLNIVDTVAQGGAGGYGGGGGGAGLGGGLFVGAGATVTISNVNFTGTQAIGGNGGAGSGLGDGGGGGGLGGSGGAFNAGGGGGGGIGVGAAGGAGQENGSAGTAVGSASGGSGGTETETGEYIVYSDTSYHYGGQGGANGGGGGGGYNIGGGGGGPGGQTVASYSTGTAGFELTFSPSSLVEGLILTALVSADVLTDGGALAAQLALNAVSQYALSHIPGYNKYSQLTVTNGGGFGTNGTSVPLPNNLPTYGFGLNLVNQGGSGSQPPGGYGGFGGGGGGGGQYSSGGNGGFGGGGGGASSGAAQNDLLGLTPGQGGFGGGAGAVGTYEYFNSSGYLKLRHSNGFYTGGFGGTGGFGTTGGGGLGAGGAIFVQAGGKLIDAGGAISSSSVQGGLDGAFAPGGYLAGYEKSVAYSNGVSPSVYSGRALGSGIFLQGQTTLTLAPGAGQSVSVGDIADEAGTYVPPGPLYAGGFPYDILVNGVAVNAGSVAVDGPGTVTLSGTNTYLGGTYLNADVLDPGPDDGFPTGGATLDIATGTSLFGTIYVPGYVANGDGDYAAATIVLSPGETLANPIDIMEPSEGDLSVDGTLVPVNYNPEPLVIVEDPGSTYTGLITGGQSVIIEGGNLGSNPTEDDAQGFGVDDQFYQTSTSGTPVLAQEQVLYQPDAYDFTVASGAEFQDLLAWVNAYNAGDYAVPQYTIYVDGQIGSTFTLNTTAIPEFQGLYGPSPGTLVIANDGGAVSGADAAHATVTLNGGAITLNPSTQLDFEGSLNVANVIQGSSGAQGVDVESLSHVTLSGANSFTGTLSIGLDASLDLAGAKAAGASTISFGAPPSFGYIYENYQNPATLQIATSTFPTNTIAGFSGGDVIDLEDAPSPTSPLVLTPNAAGQFVVDGQTLTFTDAPLNLTLSADGSGGTDLTTADFIGEAGVENDLNAAFSFTTAPSNILLDPAPAGVSGEVLLIASIDVTYALDPIGPSSLSGFLIDGQGHTIDETSGSTSLDFTGGATTLESLTITGFASGDGLVVAQGASVTAVAVSDQDGGSIAQGGTLAFTTGAVSGAFSNAGTLDARPAFGQTLTLSAAVTGGLDIGDENPASDGGTAAGGEVLATTLASVSGAVHLFGDTTLALQAGAHLGGATIVLANDGFDTLSVAGTAVPTNVIDLAAGAGVVDLEGIKVAAAQTATLSAANGLTLPGGAGSLTFSGDVTPGETFTIAPDGSGGAIVAPLSQTLSLSTADELTALEEAANTLPADTGITLTALLADNLTLTTTGPSLSSSAAGAAGALVIADGAGGPKSITLEGGSRLSLGGDNTFSGGVTLTGASTLTLDSDEAAGSGGIVLSGSAATLLVASGVDPSETITGIQPGDVIDLLGVAPPTSGTLVAGPGGEILVPTASGTVSLDLPDAVPGSVFTAVSDGSGGTKIEEQLRNETITVSNAADFEAAVQEADNTIGANVQITLAPGAGTLTLASALPPIALAGGGALAVEGHGAVIDGAGSLALFNAGATSLELSDLTLQDTGAAAAIATGNGEILQLSDVNVAGSLTAGGPVTLEALTGETQTLSGAVTASKGVALEGPGTTDVKGPFSDGGSLSLAAGALNLTGASASVTGPVVDNGALYLDVGAATTLTSALSGDGTLTSASNLTIAGAVSLAGGLDIAGSSVTYTGSSFAAPVTNDGTLILDPSAPINLAEGVTGSGALVVKGGSTTLGGSDADTGSLNVEGGTLTLATPQDFTSVTISGGDLVLGAAGSVGAQTIAFAPGPDGTLTLDAAQAADVVIDGFTTGDVIDITNVSAPATITVDGETLTVMNASGSASLVLSPDTVTTNMVYKAFSDGAGGVDVVNPADSYQVSSQSAFDAAISAIAPGGAAYESGIDYAVDVAGTIDVSQSLTTIGVATGSTLTLDGGLDFTDPTFQAGNAYSLASNAYQLVVDTPGVVFNGPVDLQGVGLDVAQGGSLLMDGGGQTGSYSRTGVQVDGTLVVSGGFYFASILAASSDPVAPPPLSGSGQILLENGKYTIGSYDGASGQFGYGPSITGTLAVDNATLNVVSLPGYTPFTINELDLYGQSTVTVDPGGVNTIRFEAGAQSTLDIPALIYSSSKATIYGVSSGDAISVSYPFGFGSSLQGASVDAHNVLHFTLTGGDVFGVQLDPAENVSTLALHVSGSTVTFEATSYTVSTPAELEAAIKAISVGGAAYGANTQFTITLAGDLTGANALQATLPEINLGSGSSLTIEGQGHTLNANTFGVFDSASPLSISSLTIQDAGSGAFQGAISLENGVSASLSDVAIEDGAASVGLDQGVFGGTFFADAPAGESDVVSDPVTAGAFVLNGPGTLDLASDNSFTGVGGGPGVTIDEGVLELDQSQSAGGEAAGGLFGSSVGVVAFAGNGEILAPSVLPDIQVENMAPGRGTLDLQGFAPSALTLTTTSLSGTLVTEVTASGSTGQVDLDKVAGSLVVFSDGDGGSLLYVAQTSLTATSGAAFASAVSAFDAGGTEAVSGVSDTIALSPASASITLSGPQPTVDQLSGAALTLNGEGGTIVGDGEPGLLVETGPFLAKNLTLEDDAAADPVLTLGSGVNGSLQNVSLLASGGGVALSLGAGDTLSLTGGALQGSVELGAGATLSLTSGASPLVLDAGLNDPLGDGSGSGEGSLQTSGDVVLDAPSDFSGGVSVAGTLQLDASDAAGFGTIALARGATLAVAAGVDVLNPITGLAAGGVIDAQGFQATGASFVGDTLVLQSASGTLSFNLAEAGLITGAVADQLSLVSDGAGGTVISFEPRQEAGVELSGTTLQLGAVHQDAVGDGTITSLFGTLLVTNTAAPGGETITGGFGSLTNGLEGGGVLDLAPGQTGTLAVELPAEPLNGGTGLYTATASLALSSAGALDIAAPINVAPVTVEAEVYAYAAPSVTETLNLGAAREGSSALTGDLTVSNGTSASAYQEGLSYSFSDPSDPSVSTSSASGSLAAGQSGVIPVTLATTSAGALDDTGLVDFVSVGAGTSNLGNTQLGQEQVTLLGTVYSTAAPVTPETLSFGTVHVGSDASIALDIGNGAPSSSTSDTLLATNTVGDTYGQLLGMSSPYDLLSPFSATAPYLAIQSGTATIAAGTVGTLGIELVGDATGTVTADAALNLVSHDDALSDLNLPTQTVLITGTVDNYASAGLSLGTGSAGTLTGSGSNYTLNFGTITSAETADLSIANTASGTADALSGYFTTTGGAGFANTGLSAFSGLSAGQSDTAPAITIEPGAGGSFTETLVLDPTGSNGSGYSGALAPVTLTVEGQSVVTTFTAATEAQLNTVIADISQGGADAFSGDSYVIDLDPTSGTMAVTSNLTAIKLDPGSSVAIAGAGSTTLAASGTIQGIVDQSGALSLEGVTLSGFTAAGGTGGTGEGGGLDLSAGVSASLSDVAFKGDAASGAAAYGANLYVGAGDAVQITSSDLSAGTLLASGLSGGSSAYLSSGAALTFSTTAGETLTVAGDIAGYGALNEAGPGELVLDAPSAYTGGTSVEGTLDIAVAGAAGTGAVTLNPGATLAIAGGGTLANTVDGFAGATLDASSIVGGSVSLKGDVLTIANATATLTVDLGQSNLSAYGLSIGVDASGGTTVSEAAPGQAPDGPAAAQVASGATTFSAVHVGTSTTATVNVANTALQGGDTLTPGLVLAPGPFSATSSASVAPGASGSVTVTYTPTKAGTYTANVPLSFDSETAGGSLTALSPVTATITGAAYAYAVADLSNTDINLGAVRLGSNATGSLIIGDGALGVGLTNPYQESLAYSVAPTPGLTVAGSSAGTVLSDQATTLQLGLASPSEGVETATTEITLASTGAGTSNLGTTTLTPSALSLTGTFYQAAQASYASSANFGWLHAGQTGEIGYTVNNASYSDPTYSDALETSVASLSNGFGATLSASNPYESAYDLSLDTNETGTITGDLTLNFISHDSALPDLETQSTPIALTGTISNFATLGLQELSGGGTLTGSGTGLAYTNGALGAELGDYTLSLGDISGPETLTFAAQNLASGFADDLAGSVTAESSTFPYTLSGGGESFAGLTAGEDGGVFTLALDTTSAGAFEETVVLSGTDSNASGYTQALPDLTLTILGAVTSGAYGFAPVETESDLVTDLGEARAGYLGQTMAGQTGPGGLAPNGYQVAYAVDLDPAAGTIGIDQPIYLGAPEGSSVTLNGNGDTLSGVATNDGLVALSGSTTLTNLTIANVQGDGFNPALSGLTVTDGASVTLNGVTFTNDSAGTYGLGDDVSVDAGGSLTVQSGTFGVSNGQGGAFNVEDGSSVDFTPAAGTNIVVAGALSGDAGSTITLDGQGTLTLDSNPGFASSTEGFAGTIDVVSGTLDLAYDPNNTSTTIVDDGTVVFQTPDPPQSDVSSQTYAGLLPTDALTIVYTEGQGPGALTQTLTVAVDGYGTEAIANALNSTDLFDATANAEPGELTIAAGGDLSAISITDATGTPLEALGLSSISATNVSIGQTLATGTLTPVFGSNDAIDIDGQTYNLNTYGVYTAGDFIDFINGLGSTPGGVDPGLTASLNSQGEIVLSSPNAEVTLADASGTPLEDLGLAPGVYGPSVEYGAVAGTGAVVVNQAPGTDLVLSGSDDWTGETDILGGTLTFTGDTSHLVGVVEDQATLAFDESGADVFNAPVTGDGAILVEGRGPVTFNTANFNAGGLTLDGGTAILANNQAAGAGPISFASGEASTLVVDKGIEPANPIFGFAPGDTITLQGFDASTTTLSAGAGDTLIIADGSGDAVTLTLSPYEIYNPSAFEISAVSGGVDLTINAAPTPANVNGEVYEVISSGGTSETLTLGPFVSDPVLSGSNETLIITSGGVVSGGSVTGGAQLEIQSGSVDSGTTIGSGGSETVSSGGSASFVNVSGGTLVVLNGGTSVDAFVTSGLASSGYLIISSGGVSSDAQIGAGGTETVSNGGASDGALVAGGGFQIISGGGSATSTTLISGGTEIVNGGGTAIDTQVSAGGFEAISGGGSSLSATILSGGSETISAYGTGNGDVVQNGGVETVLANGAVSGGVVGSGGYLAVSGGTEFGETLSGGSNALFNGAVATSVTVEGGGTLTGIGGTAYNTSIGDPSEFNVSSGFIAISTTLNSGGIQNVYRGGVASDTTIGAGSEQNVYDGGTASFTMVSAGGEQNVYDGGTASYTMISAGGSQTVFAGGSAAFATVSGNEILSGGVATSTTVNFGGELTAVSGGISENTQIYGFETVSAGGSSLNDTFDGDGFTVGSGGYVSGLTSKEAGPIAVYSGGVASDTTISGGQFDVSGGVATSVALDGGFLSIDGGSVTSITASDFAMMHWTSGSATSTTLSNGGDVNVYASAGFQALSATIGSTDTITDEGGTLSAVTVESGGAVVLGATGTVQDITVDSGGYLLISSTADVLTGVDVKLGGEIGLASTDPLFKTLTTSIFSVNGSDELTLTFNGGETLSIQLTGDYTGDYFVLPQTTNIPGGLELVLEQQPTPCFCPGTRILTDHGEVNVEHLKIGEMIMTATGEAMPLRWIGRRSYTAERARGDREILPITIKAGALGEGLPNNDLVVSPLHAMHLQDRLFPAWTLLNGRTIVQADTVEKVEYFHLELDRHALIVAEGALTESYLDDDNRSMFQNAAEYGALYPDAPKPPRFYCAPRIEEGPELEAVRRTLDAIARGDAPAQAEAIQPGTVRGFLDEADLEGVVGWAHAPDEVEKRIAVRILVDGVVRGETLADTLREGLAEAGYGDGRYGFSFAFGTRLSAFKPHVVQAICVETGLDLEGSPKLIAAAVPPRASAASAPLGALEGCLDAVSARTLTGWARNQKRPLEPVAVQVLDNNAVIARTLANRWRKDVEAAGFDDGRHGFEIVLEEPLSPHVRHVIEIRREDDGALLDGSRRIIEPAADIASNLETVLAEAIAQVGGAEDAEAAQDRALHILETQARRLKRTKAEAEARRAVRAREAQEKKRRARGPAGRTLPSRVETRQALFVDLDIPDPSRDAGSEAALSHMRGLQDLGYAVSFVSAAQIADADAAYDALTSAGVQPLKAPWYGCVEEVLKSRAGAFDLIYLHRVETAAAYLGLARLHQPRAKILFGVADLQHLRLARQGEAERRPERLAQSRRIKLMEFTAAWGADAVLTHSTMEAALLREGVPEAHVVVAPWTGGANLVAGPPTDHPGRKGVAFVGGFGHEANRDAARFLVREVWPRVRALDAGLTLKIAGSGVSDEILAFACADIEVLGRVEDLQGLFDGVRLSIAPLRYGAGVKGKVLASLKAGVPCVLTPIAAEGLAPSAFTPACLGVDADALARAVVRLHADDAARDAAAQSGLKFAREALAHERVVAALQDAVFGPGAGALKAAS